MRKSLLLIIMSFLLILTACVAPHAESLAPESSAKPAEPVLSTLDFIAELSSKKYTGRLSGSAGNALATEYIAACMADMGLEPCFGDTFFHEYATPVAEPSEANPVFTLEYETGEKETLTAGVDYFLDLVWEPLKLSGRVFSSDISECAAGEYFYLAKDEADRVNAINKGVKLIAYATDDFSANAKALTRQRTSLFLQLTQAAADKLRAPELKACALSCDATVREGKGNNVVGIVAGSGNDTGRGKASVVVCAHFDGVGYFGDTVFPSTFDNLTGLGCLIRTAQIVADKLTAAPISCDVIFAAVNSEENGRMGSIALAEKLKRDYSSLYVINIDCVGHKDGEEDYLLDDAGEYTRLTEAMTPYFKSASVKTESFSSDQASFAAAGIPAIGISQAGCFDFCHKLIDPIGAIDVQALDALASLVSDFVLEHYDDDFSQLPQASMDENVAAGNAAIAELASRLITSGELAYNELYCCEFEGERYYFTGYHPFESVEEILAVYPDVELEKFDGCIFKRAWINDGTCSPFGVTPWLAPKGYYTLEPGEKLSLELLKTEIIDIICIYDWNGVDVMVSYSFIGEASAGLIPASELVPGAPKALKLREFNGKYALCMTAHDANVHISLCGNTHEDAKRSRMPFIEPAYLTVEELSALINTLFAE